MAQRADKDIMERRISDSLSYRVEADENIGAILRLEYAECSAEERTLVLSHKIDKREVNIYGTLHGGIITWLMDSTMGTLARAYTGYETVVTMDIHVNFLKAVMAGDTAVIKAKLTHAGSRVINLVSELYVGDKLCATADAIFYNIDE